MSTFEGKLLEDSLDFIRIDQFEPKNYDGTYFLLSHFHMDHCKGLLNDNSITFCRLLNNEDKKFYCTPLTKTFLLNHGDNKIPADKVNVLEINKPTLLISEDRPTVVVTALPAGHCPGSAMFLLETETTRVLCTGDFRINPNELHKYEALHNSDGSLKKIYRLYLDTTFCHPKYLFFPSRDQTEEDLIQEVRTWLEIDSKHQVGIYYNSYFGLEFLLIALAKALNIKIQINDRRSYENYCTIPELQKRISESDSRVHLCRPVRMKCSVCWRYSDNMKTIKPCAMSFNTEQLEQGRLKKGEKVVRLAYSTHSSLEELIGTVNYLRPDAIYPCVLRQEEGWSEQEILDYLKLDVEKLKEEQREKKSSGSLSPPSKRFRTSSTTRGEEVQGEVDDDDDDDDDVDVDDAEEAEVESSIQDQQLNNLVPLTSGDEEENIPLSQNSIIDSPPL